MKGYLLKKFMQLYSYKLLSSFFFIGCLNVNGCASFSSTEDNICIIFAENPTWYKHATNAREEWGTPIALAIAFAQQENAFFQKTKSHIKYQANISNEEFSNAYGNEQTRDDAWKDYENTVVKQTVKTDFSKIIHFIGWYTHHSQNELKIPYKNVHNHYLAYHQGHSNFKKGRHLGKTALLDIAQEMATQVEKYQKQLDECEIKLIEKINLISSPVLI